MSDSYMDSAVLFHLLLGILKCLHGKELKKTIHESRFLFPRNRKVIAAMELYLYITRL